MGYDIPDPYCCDDSFQVFDEQIDEEHKKIFNAIFDLAKAPGDGGALSALTKITTDHFSFEEGMMKKANYPDFDAHHAIHVEFLGKLNGLKCPVSGDTIQFAKQWLVDHIKGTDFKYKGKL
uniref:Hemerythrin n=1 Tax=Priapulus sp. Pripap1 TaxID=2032697 RepID=A0A286RT71_9BILA|nr:hemerythrin [Priapulus sp. Pripap1]